MRKFSNRPIVFEIKEEKKEDLIKILKDLNFNFVKLNNTQFIAKKEKVTLTLFKAQRLLLQGLLEESLVDQIISKLLKAQILAINIDYQKWIGTDESGKGDIFGGICVAGVCVEESNIPFLLKIGARDSKKLSDNSIKEIAKEIKKFIPWCIVEIKPHLYNRLVEKGMKMGMILGLAHAKVIERLSKKCNCKFAICDKFTKYDEFIINNLKDKNIHVIQKERGECDIGVACASILARDAFLRQIEELKEKFKFEFPKGASKEALLIKKEFIERYGEDKKREVLKINFRV